MFFDRLGLKSFKLTPRHALRALSLAAALTLTSTLALGQELPAAQPPVVLMQVPDPEQAPAAVTQEQPSEQLSDAELLRRGVEEYRSGDYEAAQATLQQVNPDNLSGRERNTLSDTLARAQQAADQRRAARAEFELGQQALAENRPQEAAEHFRKARDNRYADSGTKDKANTQLVVAQDMIKQAAADQRRLYDEARADLREGRLEDARAKFQTLKDAGFRGGMFDRRPESYLEEIDRKLSVAQAGESAEPSPREIYRQAKRAYEQGDWIAARQGFERARELGYKPGLFEGDSPERYLARMDKKEAADRAKAEAEAQRAEQELQERLREAEARAYAEAVQQAIGGTATRVTPEAPAAPEQPVAQAPQAPQAQEVAQAPAPEQPAVESTAPAAPAGDQAATAEDVLERHARLEQIRQQRNQYMARSLVEQAREAQNAGRTDEALQLYIRALELDPSNEQARAGRQELVTVRGLEVAPGATLTERERDLRIRRQALTARFDEAITAARQAIQAGDFQTAQTQLNLARNARQSDPLIFPDDVLKRFDGEIQNVDLELQRAIESTRAQELEQRRREVEQAERQRLEEEERLRQRSVQVLVRDAIRLTREGRYQAALGVIDQILILDPTNEYAVGARPLVQDLAHFQEQRRYREEFDTQFTKQLNAAEEMKIPYDDIFRYPTNWPDISEIRDQTVREEQGLTGGDEQMAAILDRRLPEVRFDGVAFVDVVDFLRDVTGANIFVNWRALESSGVERNAPVTARLRDVKFSKALDLILADVGGGMTQLSYTVDEGVIQISTIEDLSRNVVSQVYDIRDIIFDIPDFSNAPQFSLSDSGSSGSGSNRGSSGSSGTGSLWDDSNDDDDEESTLSRQERVDEIILLIQEIVASDSWRDVGGIGSIRELSGQLIVTQTPENQRALRNLLDQLRETRAIQVTIETRFLIVQRNFLEDIGMDFDFILNQDGNISRRLSTIQINNDSADFAFQPVTGVPGSIGSNATGLTLSGTYLDDFTVNFLIRATQASQSSSQVTAPRVTLFNGQRAYVAISTEQAYVSDLTPVVGSGVGGFDPTVDVISSGVVLDVQATVSADRKYVTLTLRPTLSTLLGLERFEFQTAVPTTPPAGGGTVGGSIGSGFIQLPIMQVTQVRTTVSVPDGGTVLLGGQTIAGEIEKEAGVPVLSKIPFLKRLVTNRAMAKDEQVLLILVKPTIIITREEEQRQFPTLTSRTR